MKINGEFLPVACLAGNVSIIYTTTLMDAHIILKLGKNDIIKLLISKGAHKDARSK